MPCATGKNAIPLANREVLVYQYIRDYTELGHHGTVAATRGNKRIQVGASKRLKSTSGKICSALTDGYKNCIRIVHPIGYRIAEYAITTVSSDQRIDIDTGRAHPIATN